MSNPNTPDPMAELTFTNRAPDDKEWSAHIKLLNEWTTPDRWLREIIQYARSGPFYPADMHVDLIQQWHNQTMQQRLEEALPKKRPVFKNIVSGTGIEIVKGAEYNQAVDDFKTALSSGFPEVGGEK